MIHENIELTGSFSVTGSFNLPLYASSGSYPNPTTGSMYNDTTENIVKIYNGTQWIQVGSGSAAGGGGGSATMEYLLVGGGGGNPLGGNNGAGNGGGGGGGFISSSYSNVTSGSSFTITIGAGTTTSGDDSTIASDTFANQTAIGGGEGGSGRYANVGSGTAQTGKDGGSGGGGGNATSGDVSGGAATTGQGNAGGSGVSNQYAGGGGGGAGAAGSNAASSTGGNGGDGLQSSITGTATYYAGGGGGGTYSGTAGTGGAGGGTDGKSFSGGQPSNGTANTGGGAGGLANKSLSAPSGGSGVAIFAYDTGSASGLGGIKTLNGGRMVHTFNSSGTLTIAGAGEYPVAPSSVFAPVIYTGNGSTQSITSLNFQPDLVWIKSRSNGTNNELHDSVRGEPSRLLSDTTNQELTTANGFVSLDSNGFSLDGAGDGGEVNTSGRTYVGWCWKAGGAAVNGSGTNVSSVTQSENPDAGFGIYRFTTVNTDNTNITINHNLNAAPEMVIAKETSGTSHWYVYHSALGTDKYILMSSTNAAVSVSSAWGAGMTSSVIGARTAQGVDSGETHVAYAFHSVDGYQKVGSYTGDGGTSNAIDLGFQPRWVMIKLSSASGQNWYIMDDQRENTSVEKALSANSSAAEESLSNHLDFTSTGFTLTKSSTAFNGSGNTYIYLAIA